MKSHDKTEMVAPTEIANGDVIEDPVGHRWLTVTSIQMLSDSGSGVFSFYGGGPDDRVTFQGNEKVIARPPDMGMRLDDHVHREVPVLGLPDGVRACLFDLDGVLTHTATVHRKAWKSMFDVPAARFGQHR